MNNNLFSKRKLNIIEELINNNYYLRELSENMNLPLSTTYKEINELKKYKLITIKKIKNKTHFYLNYNSVLTREAIRIIFISKIVLSKPFREIIKEKETQKIYLFGSANKGTIKQNSDIDIGIILKEKINSSKIAKFRIELSKELNREIQTIEIDKNKLTNDENNQTLKNIINSTLIYEK
jgi:predicted nucleotidyltransferase